MVYPKLAIWLGVLVFLMGWSSHGIMGQQAEASTTGVARRCQRVCRRIQHKHLIRRCKRRWNCGPQYECRWIRYSHLDSDGNRRSYQKRQCAYVRRCSNVQVCRYLKWTLQCRNICTNSPEQPLAHLSEEQRHKLVNLKTCGLRGEELLLFQQVNLARLRHKRHPLRCLTKLINAARQWSQVQCFRGQLSHSRLRERLQKAGFHCKQYAENVAAGRNTAVQVFHRWMRSPHHRRHILHPKFTHFGGGLYLCSSSKYTHFWTQLFVKK